ncbi:MAG: YIP1 family protein [Bacillota bacterium]
MSDIRVKNANEVVACKRPGFFKRLLWVFTSPGRLAAELAEKPRVLFGLIAGALAQATLYLSRLTLYTDRIREEALRQADSGFYESFGLEMTPEMIEASLPVSVKTGLIGTPPVMIFVILFITFVFFAILKLIGGQGKFKAYLSVVVHANLIPVLYTLLCIPISFITGSLHDEVRLTSLATLASADMAGTVLYAILARIDIVSIWNYAVMAIGFTEVSKLKKKYVYSIVAGIFIIGVIISIAGTLAVKAFM